MITNAKSNVSSECDLLPWADPYIQQLFREAELQESRQTAEQVEEKISMTVTLAEAAAREAAMFDKARSATTTRHRPIARRRRIEFARQLAPR